MVDTENTNNFRSGLISDNSGYHNASIVQFRLDTDPLMADIELFLRGERQRYTEADGEIGTVEREKVGEPVCNDKGVQHIMSYVQSMVNPMTVQGNVEDEEYRNYLYRHRISFAKDLMINLHYYGIREETYGGLIAHIFALVELFITRTIENEERKSLTQGIRVIERSSSEVQGKKGVKMPFVGG